MDLAETLQSILNTIPLPELKKAAEDLSLRYRTQKKPFFDTKLHRYAYLACRFPATYAAAIAVFSELKKRSVEKYCSFLDLGAGPGTATLAVQSIFDEIEQITLIEDDHELLSLGKKLNSRGQWKKENLLKAEFVAHDLVTLSYALGELPREAMASFVEKCWKATKKAFVLIEPGTPKGFETLLLARNHLIALGAPLLAPCPHANRCPHQEWCHFSARAERSEIHRFAKDARLPYEDEKFCYMIFGKGIPAEARLLHDPQKRSGHVILTLCTQNEIKTCIVSHKYKENFKKARKAQWGDEWT